MFELPRCDDLDEDWFLTNDEKRELIIEMATKGSCIEMHACCRISSACVHERRSRW